MKGRPKSQPADPIRDYLRGEDALTPFCAARGLDPKVFKRQVIAWRHQHAQRVVQRAARRDAQ